MELQEVNINENKPLLFGKQPTSGSEEKVDCTYTVNGSTHSTKLLVNIQGDRNNKSCHQAMITFHDVGLNYMSNFSTLFNSEYMEPVRQNFCVYHINAPGMEEKAEKLPDCFVYPSMENLSDMIPTVMAKFDIKRAIFVGCGAGANVFMRFAMKNPNRVDGLVAVNAIASAQGTMGWLFEKIANITTPLHEQMLHYHFTREEAEKANHDLIEAHRKHFQQINHHNMHLFVKEFERRDELAIHRSIDPNTSIQTTLKCSTLLLVGDLSPFVEDVVEVNIRLDPAKTQLLKMSDAGGMVMEEQTYKVAEALIFFLQGLGNIPQVAMSRLSKNRTISQCSIGSGDGDERKRTVSEGDKGTVHKETSVNMTATYNDKTQLVTGAVC